MKKMVTGAHLAYVSAKILKADTRLGDVGRRSAAAREVPEVRLL